MAVRRAAVAWTVAAVIVAAVIAVCWRLSTTQVLVRNRSGQTIRYITLVYRPGVFSPRSPVQLGELPSGRTAAKRISTEGSVLMRFLNERQQVIEASEGYTTSGRVVFDVRPDGTVAVHSSHSWM